MGCSVIPAEAISARTCPTGDDRAPFLFFLRSSIHKHWTAPAAKLTKSPNHHRFLSAHFGREVPRLVTSILLICMATAGGSRNYREFSSFHVIKTQCRHLVPGSCILPRTFFSLQAADYRSPWRPVDGAPCCRNWVQSPLISSHTATLPSNLRYAQHFGLHSIT